MLGYFKKSREQIVKIIKKSPITEDGFYFCKRFPDLNNALGQKKEPKYTFDRIYFENKICFNNGEIEIYLEQDNSNFNIIKMKEKDNFLKEVVGDYIDQYKLNSKIKNQQFTLGELIDSTIFYFNYKNNY